MIIKVCGMRDPENIRAVESAHPDWMGFILWPGSKRHVPAPPAYLPASTVKRVGVFVNPTLDDVVEQCTLFALDLIQLHGQEEPSFCETVRKATAKPVIKAFGIRSAADLNEVSRFQGAADYFLFDTRSPLPGGSGLQFDWSILDAYEGSTPFLLSGGIGPEDLSRLLSYRHPRCIGFDLNSRFETAPAMKDAALLAPFIRQLKSSGQ